MKKLYFLFFIFFILNISCKKDSSVTEPTNNKYERGGKITVGEEVSVLTDNVGPEGKTIEVPDNGSPIATMQIKIEPNSFSTNQQIKISYSPVVSHNYGEKFTAASPLISITGNDEYASEDIKLKIPISISSKTIAMGFFIDRQTGELEGLPIEDMTNEYIEISTRHFPSYNGTRKASSNSLINEQDLIILTTQEDMFLEHSILGTGFKPSRDDWEFVNYGSYIAPNGHCAGQSITALWFFDERQNSEGPLFHRYDLLNYPGNPDSMWWDNPKGYRFASTVQRDINWSMDKIIEYTDYSKDHPKFTWWAFCMAIALTGKPQYITVWNNNTAHAMIVYEIDLTSRKLIIADPNYPDNKQNGLTIERYITYDPASKSLSAYTSRPNANEEDERYPYCAFWGKYAIIEKRIIDNRWKEFTAGNIGNDQIPAYTLYDDMNDKPISDDYSTTEKQITIYCRAKCDSSYKGTEDIQPFEVVNSEGKYLVKVNNLYNCKADIKLNTGDNKLGFIIYGYKQTKKYKEMKYIDFKWVTIKSTYTPPPLSISPANLQAQLYGTYSFSALYEGTLPAHYTCQWSYGIPGSEGTVVKIQNDLNAKLRFTKEGTNTIYVSLIDDDTKQTIDYTSTNATVTKGPLSNLYHANKISFYFQSDGVYNPSDLHYIKLNAEEENISWSGQSFSANYNYSRSDIVFGDTLFYSVDIEGTVALDGSAVTQLTFNHKLIKCSKSQYKYDFSIDLNNLALTYYEDGNSYCELVGDAINQSLNNIAYTVTTQYGYPPSTWGTFVLQNLDINGSSRLSIKFY